MSEKQLSRVAGVPRLPLPIFKAAADRYFVGKDASRTEQQNGRKSKVQLLRQLSANDPAVRSWLIKFAKEFKAEETRKKAAEQGLTINEAAPGRTLSLVDRMVAVLEAGQRLEDHFTKEELESPADPKHGELWAGYQRYVQTGSIKEQAVTHGCNYCGRPATRQIGTVRYCDQHDGCPTGPTMQGSF
jgi:hypothetical protein